MIGSAGSREAKRLPNVRRMPDVCSILRHEHERNVCNVYKLPSKRLENPRLPKPSRHANARKLRACQGFLMPLHSKAAQARPSAKLQSRPCSSRTNRRHPGFEVHNPNILKGTGRERDTFPDSQTERLISLARLQGWQGWAWRLR